MRILKQFYYDIKKKLGFSKSRPNFSKTHAMEKLELMEERKREREEEFEKGMIKKKKIGRRVGMATKKTTKKKTTKKKTTTKKKACKRKTTKKTTKKKTTKKTTKKKTTKKKKK